MSHLEQLRQLANVMTDGTASPADATRLSAMLRDHVELRDAYLSYLDTHATLCWEFRNLAHTMAVEQPSPATVVPLQRSPVATLLPWMVAVVAIVVAVVTLVRPKEQAGFETPGAAATSTASLSGSIAALLVDEAGAEFAAGRGPDGVRFGPGEYELLKGVVHLRFAQGADLVLASPARLDVTDSLHTRLAYGNVRVIAPPSARGFTVATPAADYVDLGTEFGLRVERGDGASDLYVFDGQVNVEDSRSGKVLSEVFEGKSSRHVYGVIGEAPELSADDFPTPGTIGFVRWQEYEQRLRQDRGLLAFFPFRRTADESLLMNAQNSHVVADGRVTGARWASGRWPGKEALLFDRDSDFVQIDIPGEYPELTIAVWLKLDRLDFELNAILNSDGADDGDVHFQLTRQGLPRGGVLGSEYSNEKFFGNLVPVGKWAHVVFVISAPNRTSRLYVNGKLAFDRQFHGDGVIRPGSCRLGNWLLAAPENVPLRPLRGRIDELAIWNRALPEDELSRLVEAGRPGLLWSDETQNLK